MQALCGSTYVPLCAASTAARVVGIPRFCCRSCHLVRGDAGLRRGASAKSSFLVQPGEPIYVDLLLMPTADCDAILRPGGARPGYELAFAHDGNAKSLLCKRGKP